MALENLISKIEETFTNLLHKCYDFFYKHRTLIFWLCIVLAASLIFLWTYFVPISRVDDTPNLYVCLDPAQGRISSLQDIIKTQIHFWNSWSGRVLLHGSLEFLLMMGKPIISLVSALVFISIGFLGSKLINPDNHYRKIQVLLILALFYYFNPAWNDVTLWTTGFAVYALPIPFVLTFLYCILNPLKNAKLEPWINNSIVFAFLGFVVGASNENVSVALVLLMLVYLFYLKSINKLEAKHIISYLFLIAGCCLLMFAPGNAVRAVTVKDIAQTSFIYNLMVRISTFALALSETGFYSILFVIITYMFADKAMLHKNKIVYFLVGLGALEMLAILGVPQGFPVRSFTPSLICFLTAAIINLQNSKVYLSHRKRFSVIFFVVFIAFIVTAGFYTTFTMINPLPIHP